MKKTFILAISVFLLAGCARENEFAPRQITDEANRVEYNFTVEIDTKASISDAGVFSWTAGDKVAVWDSQNNTFDEFVAQQDGANTTITGTGLSNANYTKAYYPSTVATAGENSIVWPDSYASAAVAAKSFPMMAVNDNGTLSFKHLGALLKLTIEDLPSNVSSLVFTAANKGVSGTLAVDATDAEHPFCAVGNTSSSITVSTDDATSTAEGTVFYLPLPTGTLTGGFSIDFKLGTKVVGTKSTTNDVSLVRAKVKPMTAFTPTFNWPNNTDAFDYGYNKGETRTATYLTATDRAEANVTSTRIPTGESRLLDGVTYYAGLKFDGNRWTSQQVSMPSSFSGESNLVPQDNCFSWKVNRPGTVSYFCCVYNSNFLQREVQYSLVLVKTVNGVTTAEVLKTIKPNPENIMYAYDGTNKVNNSTWPSNIGNPDYTIVFEVNSEDLIGIDAAATLYLYHHTKASLGTAQVYHCPIKWTPSVDKCPVPFEA